MNGEILGSYWSSMSNIVDFANDDEIKFTLPSHEYYFDYKNKKVEKIIKNITGCKRYSILSNNLYTDLLSKCPNKPTLIKQPSGEIALFIPYLQLIAIKGTPHM